MSKSLGNFYTLPDLLEKGYTGRDIRYALMRVHYRAPLNFTWEGMEESRESLKRIDEWIIRLTELARPDQPGETGLTAFADYFFRALDDDLNISAALGHLFNLVGQSNRAMTDNALDAASAQRLLERWREIDSVLKIGPDVHIRVAGVQAKANVGTVFVLTSDAPVPTEIAALAEVRAQARLAKDFRKSDELRNKLNARGWEVRDTKDGQKVTRRAGG
jgi:cysteinyl-tRNA synthetase